MKNIRSTTIALAIAGVIALPGAIHAQVVTYSTRSIFLSAISGATTVGFSGGQVNVLTPESGTVSTGGVTLNTSSPNQLDITDGSPYGATGTVQVLIANPNTYAAGNEALTIGLSGAENAFGFDFGDFTSDIFTYVLKNGSTTVGTGTFSNPTTDAFSFFGVTSNTAFNSVTISVKSALTAYDNITYAPTLATVTATPEPGTIGLMATGLIGIAGFVRRKKNNA